MSSKIVNRALDTLRDELTESFEYLQHDCFKDNETIKELLIGNLNSSIRNFQLINDLLALLSSKEEMLESIAEIISNQSEEKSVILNDKDTEFEETVLAKDNCSYPDDEDIVKEEGFWTEE